MNKQVYIVQYSRPTNTRIAISDWIEYTTKVIADSIDEAIEKFNHNRKGTWYILDCYPE